jgi:hypothetical protein
VLPFLLLALVACVGLAERPTGWMLVLGVVATACATALKTSAFLVVASILVAAAAAVRQRVWAWGLGAAALLLAAVLAGVALGGIPRLWGLPAPDLASPAGVVRSLSAFAVAYVRDLAPGLPGGLGAAVRILRQWLGVVGVAGLAAGIAWALWRRARADLVLLAFIGPTFVLAAMFPWLDERYLLPILPAAWVMLGRLAAETWPCRGEGQGRWRFERLTRRAAVVLAVGLPLAFGLGQSVRQGRLLALPDTRALAGRWAEAHLPRTARVAAEGYFPLGLDRWPRASPLDPTRPVADEVGRSDVVVTSSLQHRRYLDSPARYPAEARFFRELGGLVTPIRSFALGGFGFIHPRIDFHVPGPPPGAPPARLLLPRPFDASWSSGVSFLDTGAYDRDDRTVRLAPGQRHTLTLVSAAPVGELAVFVAAGAAGAQVRVGTRWQSRAAAVSPGTLSVLTLRPRSLSPLRPVLCPLRLSLALNSGPALVQVRAGPREIGETLVQWERWPEAIAHLERATGALTGRPPPDGIDPSEIALRLLLVTAYQRAGRPAEARQALATLRAAAPAAVERHLALGRPAEPPESWPSAFRAATGLDPALLAASLGVLLEAEALGGDDLRIVADPRASGGRAVELSTRGSTLQGPDRLHLPRGAYLARFALRAAGADAAPLAGLRVFAERRLAAVRTVTAADLRAGGEAADVALPFVHERHGERIAVRIEALGAGPVLVDRIRIEPDLWASFEEQRRDIAQVEHPGG